MLDGDDSTIDVLADCGKTLNFDPKIYVAQQANLLLQSASDSAVKGGEVVGQRVEIGASSVGGW